MRRNRRVKVVVADCSERKRLGKAFLAVCEKFRTELGRTVKKLSRGSKFVPDVTKIQDIRDRLERAHKLFGDHIDKHGCWQVKQSPLKSGAKRKRRGA